ncbi:DUF6000 family protein [Winogradskya humida]|uniref:Uncharacterized protein n=1 Tax=Winogradskya humida TaxID=113566 RepID=A0ABQ3ZG00_9ACTN|nr:DUF6000 family protein [Actinoplanes humidus]GIE17459.1 hypothetical protein Ahu01nite_005610 [Actinoplanes humidus]
MTSTAARYISVGEDGPDGPRYMNLPNGITMPTRIQKENFARDLGRDARQITDAELRTLLEPDRVMANWRTRLVSAYLIAVDRRTQFRDAIGRLLLQGRTVSAGSGYSFALAAFGTDQDAETLGAYLDKHLPLVEERDAQPWALGALIYLDHRLGTDRAEHFLADGIWERWAQAAPNQGDITSYSESIEELCGLSQEPARLI